jgi:AraC-like DNA-binding protein
VLSATDLSWAARMSSLDLGSVRLVDCAATPCRGRRGRAELARTDGEWVIAAILRHGRSRFSQGDCRAEPVPGSVIVWHSAAPAEFAITEKLVKRCVIVPRDVLGAVSRSLDHVSALELVAGNPTVQLFRSVAHDVARCAADLDAGARIASGRVLTELLSTCLAPHRLPGRAALQAGLFARAREHIERRVGDPSLRPGTVAAELRVPLRTLQDVFAQRGETIWGYIRDLRLERCNAELRTGTDRTVTEIAFAHGFTNAAHFTRCFRERYGMTPRDARAASLAA